jgi:hypothetical protein
VLLAAQTTSCPCSRRLFGRVSTPPLSHQKLCGSQGTRIYKLNPRLRSAPVAASAVHWRRPAVLAGASQRRPLACERACRGWTMGVLLEALRSRRPSLAACWPAHEGACFPRCRCVDLPALPEPGGRRLAVCALVGTPEAMLDC